MTTPVLIRNLTAEEIARVSVQGHGRPIAPQTKLLEQMNIGDGILVSHEGLFCRKSKAGNSNCSLATIASRMRKQTGLHYRLRHTNGVGSDVMVVCLTGAAK